MIGMRLIQLTKIFGCITFAAIFTFSATSQQLSTQIKLNQIGFYPDAPKVAIITGDVNATAFYVTSTNLRDTFYTGFLGNTKQSQYSKTTTRLADFSSLSTKMDIHVPGWPCASLQKNISTKSLLTPPNVGGSSYFQ